MKREKVFSMPFCNFIELNPVDAGWQDCPPGYKFGPHARSYHILHYVTEGKGTLRKNNVETAVGKGQCFVIRSGETAAYSADTNEPWSYIWLGFNTTLVLPGIIANEDVFDAEFCKEIFMNLKTLDPSDSNLDYILCGKCWELFAALGKNDRRSVSCDIAYRAKNYIDNAFRSDITVSDVAEKLYVERTTFSKMFKRRFGVSPQEYICSCRLEEACRLIKNSNLPLSDIAAACGYKDYINFSKMFSKKYGVSPKRYKQMCADC